MSAAASIDWASGNFTPDNTSINTPVPTGVDSSSGSFWTGLVGGLNTVGLDWYTAATKGVSGPLPTPAVATTTGGATVGLAQSADSGILLLAVLGIVAFVIIKKA